MSPGTASELRRLPSRKDGTVSAWGARYEELALSGVRSREVTERIALHLHRFAEYLGYGQDKAEKSIRAGEGRYLSTGSRSRARVRSSALGRV